MDGNGGCCIARWTDEGHVTADYDLSKMDMIMLKFRPIAPKPVSDNGSVGTALGNPNSNPHEAGLCKTAPKGRRKSGTSKKNNNNNNNNGKKRKSSSPDNQDQKRDVTLLPLFPEEPDLSSSVTQTNSVPIWLNFGNSNNNSYYNNNNYNSI